MGTYQVRNAPCPVWAPAYPLGRGAAFFCGGGGRPRTRRRNRVNPKTSRRMIDSLAACERTLLQTRIRKDESQGLKPDVDVIGLTARLKSCLTLLGSTSSLSTVCNASLRSLRTTGSMFVYCTSTTVLPCAGRVTLTSFAALLVSMVHASRAACFLSSRPSSVQVARRVTGLLSRLKKAKYSA